MSAPAFHTYAQKILRAARAADADATHAQREAGNAAVGKVHLHGFRVSIEYPKGAVRKGKKPDGTEWSRIVQNPYGYIRGTDGGDGEHLDVWLGDHPESQLVFCFQFLTASGEDDEIKAVMGCRNLAEAKTVIRKNYPDNFIEERVGEIRGYFLPQFRQHLKQVGVMKKSAGFFCKECNEFHKDRSKEDGCPECNKTASVTARLAALGEDLWPAKSTA